MYNTFFCTNDTKYVIKPEKSNYFAIYLNHCGHETPVTHRPTLKSAQKLAKLLSQAYQTGWDHGNG